MHYRQLGRSGLRVSSLSMGTMTFGRAAGRALSGVGVEEARELVGPCLDAGVNLVDTADVYGKRDSEPVLGQALGAKRNDVLIATKVGGSMGPAPNDRGSSRHHVVAACEASLERLRTDWIDLYRLHKWDGMSPPDETLEALDRLVCDGKVRYVGCSNFSAWRTMKLLSLADAHGWPWLVSQQIHYTVEAREADYELVPLTLDPGLGIMVWGPIASGLLSGKYRRSTQGPQGSRHFRRQWHEPPIYDDGRLFDIVVALVDIWQAHGRSAGQVAIAWLLHQSGVGTVLIGGRTREQFADNLAAADLSLGPEELARLDAGSRPKPIYPYWHQAWTDPERLSSADLSLLATYQETRPQ